MPDDIEQTKMLLPEVDLLPPVLTEEECAERQRQCDEALLRWLIELNKIVEEVNAESRMTRPPEIDS